MRTDADFVPSYGTSSRIAEIQAIVTTGAFQESATKLRARDYVKDRAVVEWSGKVPEPNQPREDEKHERTTKRHGISGPEVARERDALHLLETSRMACFWAVLGDELLTLPVDESRAIIDAFTSRIVREQRKVGLPQYWLRLLECSSGLHANIVFPATPELVAKLRRSPQFQPYLQGSRAIQRVNNFDRLGRVYFAKERVPFATGTSRCGRRRKGAHYLEGGGDRVRLSRALKEDALALGMTKPWRSTNAKRNAA
jgi:hypothetical protein